MDRPRPRRRVHSWRPEKTCSRSHRGAARARPSITGPHELRSLVEEPHRPCTTTLLVAGCRARSSRIGMRSCGRSWRGVSLHSGVLGAPSSGPISRPSYPSASSARSIGLPPMDDPALRRAKGFTDAVLAWRHSYGADPAPSRPRSTRPKRWRLRSAPSSRLAATDRRTTYQWPAGDRAIDCPNVGGTGRHRQCRSRCSRPVLRRRRC